jgi:hypothetical protein
LIGFIFWLGGLVEKPIVADVRADAPARAYDGGDPEPVPAE